MKNLRLLFTSQCDRRCKQCCNLSWDLTKLPICQSFSGLDIVSITGGEPMLFKDRLKGTINMIRYQSPKAKIFLYTANVKELEASLEIFKLLDGVTLTIHTIRDIDRFKIFNDLLLKNKDLLVGKSLRLNVFEKVATSNFLRVIDLSLWTVDDNRTWIKDCPLPEGEVFMRL